MFSLMHMRHYHALAVLLPAFAAATSVRSQAAEAPAPSELKYPPAQRDSTTDTYFGTQVPAPYQWMEELDSPALQQWVEEENKLAFSYLEKIPVRNWMKERLTTLWNYARESTPELVEGGRIFLGKNSGLQNQSVVYFQDPGAPAPNLLLDPNTLSADGSLALLGYQPSPHGVYLAYNLSQGGSDWLTIHVREVATGKDLPDTIRWVKFSGLAWTKDGKGFFYSRYPEPPAGKSISQQVINQKIYYHRLGTEQSADPLIYERPDLPAWMSGGSVTEDGRYLFIYLQNGTAPQNELFYLDLRSPLKPSISGEPKPLYTKNDAEYGVIGHAGKTLFIQTTLDAPKRRIVAARLDQPDPAHWRVLVPEGEGVIQASSMAGGQILVNYEVVAKSRLALFSTEGRPLGELSLPAMAPSVGSLRATTRTPFIMGSRLFSTPIRCIGTNSRRARRTCSSSPRSISIQPPTISSRSFIHPRPARRFRCSSSRNGT
ncbi:Prolyl endopeptidase (fragment) [Verrucomicrobia bacterium]